MNIISLAVRVLDDDLCSPLSWLYYIYHTLYLVYHTGTQNALYNMIHNKQASLRADTEVYSLYFHTLHSRLQPWNWISSADIYTWWHKTILNKSYYTTIATSTFSSSCKFIDMMCKKKYGWGRVLILLVTVETRISGVRQWSEQISWWNTHQTHLSRTLTVLFT